MHACAQAEQQQEAKARLAANNNALEETVRQQTRQITELLTELLTEFQGFRCAVLAAAATQIADDRYPRVRLSCSLCVCTSELRRMISVLLVLCRRVEYICFLIPTAWFACSHSGTKIWHKLFCTR